MFCALYNFIFVFSGHCRLVIVSYQKNLFFLEGLEHSMTTLKTDGLYFLLLTLADKDKMWCSLLTKRPPTSLPVKRVSKCVQSLLNVVLVFRVSKHTNLA